MRAVRSVGVTGDRMKSVRRFGVTIDFETLGEKDSALRDTVTLRERDSMKQERVRDSRAAGDLARTTGLMDLAEFREYCLGKPGAPKETPFGPDVIVFKVARQDVRASGSR